MRILTLKGFLKKYIKSLSLSNTCNIAKLIKEVERNPRIKEPLVLYAILSGVSETTLSKNKMVYEEYMLVKERFDDYDSISSKYNKVKMAYLFEKNKHLNDDDTKHRMRSKILELQQEKSVSNYRIYTDLHLNKGNTNSFIKNGNPRRLSLRNVRKIWKYLQDK